MSPILSITHSVNASEGTKTRMSQTDTASTLKGLIIKQGYKINNEKKKKMKC